MTISKPPPTTAYWTIHTNAKASNCLWTSRLQYISSFAPSVFGSVQAVAQWHFSEGRCNYKLQAAVIFQSDMVLKSLMARNGQNSQSCGCHEWRFPLKSDSKSWPRSVVASSFLHKLKFTEGYNMFWDSTASNFLNLSTKIIWNGQIVYYFLINAVTLTVQTVGLITAPC